MIYFTTPKSAGYGARIFIQKANNAVQVDHLAGLHTLASTLSYWKGPDKSVAIPKQDCAEAWAKTGLPGFKGYISSDVSLAGYEMDPEEMAVMEKRCKAVGMINITPIISDLKQEWH